MLSTGLDREDTVMNTFFDFNMPINLWEETDSLLTMIQFIKWSNGPIIMEALRTN